MTAPVQSLTAAPAQVSPTQAKPVVSPGGIEAWKVGERNVTGIDTPVGGRLVTPRAILEVLTDAANALRLPHPVHIHCNNLGIPGNAATTIATMEALSGRRAHRR